MTDTTITFAASRTVTLLWRPILNGELESRARLAIKLIDQDLTGRGEQLIAEPSLAGGAAGLALYHAYHAQAQGGEQAERQAMSWLERAIAGACRQALPPSLYSGLAGVAWTLAHLSDACDRADDNQFTAIDDLLADYLQRHAAAGEYELVNGLVGMGVYAIERLPSPTAKSLLEQIIDHLDRRASRTSQGITWWTPAVELPSGERAEFPSGYANLGVAHGVPGVIGLLAQAISRGVAVQQSARLLSGAVEWLLAQRLPAGAGGHFGYHAVEGAAPEPARLAWCYGDLSIAAVLLTAAQATGEASWKREAVRLARTAARRASLADSGVEDAGLCHGAAGVAHLFNRIYQATGDPGLLEAAVHWFDATMRFHSNERGVGGFAAKQTHGPHAGQLTDDASFLEGAAGVALALLAATTFAPPRWDRLLLCSLPE